MGSQKSTQTEVLFIYRGYLLGFRDLHFHRQTARKRIKECHARQIFGQLCHWQLVNVGHDVNLVLSWQLCLHLFADLPRKKKTSFWILRFVDWAFGHHGFPGRGLCWPRSIQSARFIQAGGMQFSALEGRYGQFTLSGTFIIICSVSYILHITLPDYDSLNHSSFGRGESSYRVWAKRNT